jgi:Protein of unknown function (DUF998)
MAPIRNRRAFVQRTTAPLGVFAFWLGMAAAARSYPSQYDWRYLTISSLVYPDRNPHGYLWARAGMVLCGLTGLYWTVGVMRAAQRPGGAGWPVGIAALAAGFMCMASCGLLPEWRLSSGRVHEFLALAAFLGIGAGVVLATLRSLLRGGPLPGSPGGSRLAARLRAGFVAAVPMAPIALAALAQTYVSAALPTLPWVNLSWRARGVPVYLSFAFWEWVSCALFSLYLVVLSGTETRARR